MANLANEIKTINGLPMGVITKTKPEFNYQLYTVKYFNQIYELYSTTFKWNDFPSYMYEEGVEPFIENTLTGEGKVLFFRDDILDKFFVYKYTGHGFNFYQRPVRYIVSNPAGYTATIERENAVEIWNSPYRTNENVNIMTFAETLAYIDLLIYQNLQTQKMPYIIMCSDNQRQTLVNFMSKLDAMENMIFTTKDFDLDSIKVLQTKSEFLGLSLYELKSKIWKEALRFCGIAETEQKKERLIVNEQMAVEGEANALLITRLKQRQEACQQINEKFGLNVSVSVREDLGMRVEMLNPENYANFLNMFSTDNNENEEEG